MKRTARRIAFSTAAAAVSLAMAAPAAVAHDGYRSYDGYRSHDGYSSGYGGEGDGYGEHDGDHSGDDREHAGDRSGDRWGDHDGDHDGDRYGDHDGERDGYRTGDKEGDRSRNDHAGDGSGSSAGSGLAGSGTFRQAHDHTATAPGSEGALVQQKRAMLTYLSRAGVFLSELRDRVAGSDLDPSVKTALLSAIADRQASVERLKEQLQTVGTLHELGALRRTTHSDAHI